MGTPSAEQEHHEYEKECKYRLLEEGRSWSPPPAATAVPSQPPSSTNGGAPCTTPEPPRTRIPAWASSAIRGFNNTLFVVFLVFVVAPLAMQSTNKEKVFLCVSLFFLFFIIPLLGYAITWDQPGWL